MSVSSDSESACHSQARFHALINGQLEESMADALFDHLEDCERCQNALRSVTDNNSTANQSAKLIVAEPEFARMRTALESLTPPSALRSDATAPRMLTDLVGRTIDEYQFTKRIGAGGMAVVYRALHSRLQREVAVKCIAANRSSAGEWQERFRREVMATGRLDHPAIVQTLDARLTDDYWLLVMELVHGNDLSCVVRSHGPLTEANACEIIRQATLGVQHAHEQALIHRDLKPSNIMLTASGQVKILDFGVALSTRRQVTSETLTDTGQIMGTLDYMAPEQLDCPHAVDIRADLFSLGCTLFKLVSQTGPWDHLREASILRRLKLQATGAPPSLSAVNPESSPELIAVVDRMLQQSPDDRYESPAELLADLTPLCEGADLPLLAKETNTLSADPPTESDCSQERFQTGQRKTRRTRTGVVLLALGICVYFALTRLLPDSTNSLGDGENTVTFAPQTQPSGTLAASVDLLQHRYSFNSDDEFPQAVDSVGGAHAAIRYFNRYPAGGVRLVGIPGEHLEIPAALLEGQTELTLEFRATWTGFGPAPNRLLSLGIQPEQSGWKSAADQAIINLTRMLVQMRRLDTRGYVWNHSDHAANQIFQRLPGRTVLRLLANAGLSDALQSVRFAPPVSLNIDLYAAARNANHAGDGTLRPGEYLIAGESIVSTDGSVRLVLEKVPQQGIRGVHAVYLYHHNREKTPIWVGGIHQLESGQLSLDVFATEFAPEAADQVSLLKVENSGQITLFDSNARKLKSLPFTALSVKKLESHFGAVAVKYPDDEHHVVLTIRGSTASLWVNGKHSGSGELTSDFRLADCRHLLGGSASPDVPGFDGIFKEFRVFHRILSEQEISASFKGAQPDDFAWDFNLQPQNMLKDSTGRESLNTGLSGSLPSLPEINNGQLHLSGGVSSAAPYLDLPNHLVSQLHGSHATFEIWITAPPHPTVISRLLTVNSTSRGEIHDVGGRFREMGNGASWFTVAVVPAAGRSSLSMGTNDGTNSWQSDLFGDDLLDNAEHCLAITIAGPEGKQATAWIDGEKRMELKLEQGLDHIDDVNIWLGRSEDSGNSNLQARINEFRIYDFALTQDQVQTSYASGPDAEISGSGKHTKWNVPTEQ